MMLKKWVKVVSVAAAILMVSACSSKHKMQDDLAVNDANSAYNDDAQASGLGDDNSVGDDGASKSGRRLSASHRVYHFDFDSSDVHEDDKEAIANHASRLSSKPGQRVIVEGHTDQRGSREYNIGLGERRARAVSKVLTENGVNRSQMRIVSYGAEKLASHDHNESGYQENRRAVLADIQR